MEAMVRGCRIACRFEKAQGAQGPVILLLHGWGCDGRVFAPLMKTLSGRASILTLDFPGHGESADPPEPWDVACYADMLSELLQRLDIHEVDVVAHSFGARVAIRLATAEPGLIRRQVFTGGAGIRSPLSEAQKKRQRRYRRLRAVMDVLARIPLLGRWAEKGRASLRRRYGSADYAKLNDCMRATFVKVVNEDLSPLLKDIRASTLLIWGENDTATPLWMAKQMERDIPDAGLVVFEGRTHFAFLEEPDRFARIVEQFFFGGPSV